MIKIVLGAVASFLVAMVLLFALNSMGMVSKGFFGKWNEEIRYDITKESAAYRDGMQRNLSQMQTDYNSADSSGKIGIRQAVRHQYSQTDTAEYPAYLQTFLTQMGL
tara:strand:- start:953 stop:1273 length:321 start_codon:yes stop_codon:yes gene_type:complete